jgi:hypothetical protein
VKIFLRNQLPELVKSKTTNPLLRVTNTLRDLEKGFVQETRLLRLERPNREAHE